MNVPKFAIGDKLSYATAIELWPQDLCPILTVRVVTHERTESTDEYVYGCDLVNPKVEGRALWNDSSVPSPVIPELRTVYGLAYFDERVLAKLDPALIGHTATRKRHQEEESEAKKLREQVRDIRSLKQDLEDMTDDLKKKVGH